MNPTTDTASNEKKKEGVNPPKEQKSQKKQYHKGESAYSGVNPPKNPGITKPDRVYTKPIDREASRRCFEMLRELYDLIKSTFPHNTRSLEALGYIDRCKAMLGEAANQELL